MWWMITSSTSKLAKIIVFQCPKSFAPTAENKENLKKFFKKIKRKNYLFAWEPRGDWKEKEIEKLCKDLDLIHCVDPFKNKTTTKKLAYFRLHGKKRYRYNYTDSDLEDLKKLGEGFSEVYYLFNNISMYEDAKRIKKTKI